jgi:hypothetical protein
MATTTAAGLGVSLDPLRSAAMVTRTLTRTQVATTARRTTEYGASGGYGASFGKARACLESWMRGDPLDVDALVDALRPLPQNVCRTLLRGLPREQRDDVMARLQ